jgi:hypothetical protein
MWIRRFKKNYKACRKKIRAQSQSSWKEDKNQRVRSKLYSSLRKVQFSTPTTPNPRFSFIPILSPQGSSFFGIDIMYSTYYHLTISIFIYKKRKIHPSVVTSDTTCFFPVEPVLAPSHIFFRTPAMKIGGKVVELCKRCLDKERRSASSFSGCGGSGGGICGSKLYWDTSTEWTGVGIVVTSDHTNTSHATGGSSASLISGNLCSERLSRILVHAHSNPK